MESAKNRKLTAKNDFHGEKPFALRLLVCESVCVVFCAVLDECGGCKRLRRWTPVWGELDDFLLFLLLLLLFGNTRKVRCF